MLSLYRRLLALRREQPALRVGSFRLLEPDEHVFAYERAHGGVRWIAVLNFSGEPQTYRLPADDEAEVAVSTVGLGGAVIAGELELAPNEALVARVLA